MTSPASAIVEETLTARWGLTRSHWPAATPAPKQPLLKTFPICPRGATMSHRDK